MDLGTAIRFQDPSAIKTALFQFENQLCTPFKDKRWPLTGINLIGGTKTLRSR